MYETIKPLNRQMQGYTNYLPWIFMKNKNKLKEKKAKLQNPYYLFEECNVLL